MLSVNEKMDSHNEAREFLSVLRISYPILLFAVFVVGFFVNSILVATRSSGNNPKGECTGPGGKPLPKRQRTAGVGTALRIPDRFSPRTVVLFRWLSVGVILTFAADAAVSITSIVLRRSQHWWPGQAFVVSSYAMIPPPAKS